MPGLELHQSSCHLTTLTLTQRAGEIGTVTVTAPQTPTAPTTATTAGLTTMVTVTGRPTTIVTDRPITTVTDRLRTSGTSTTGTRAVPTRLRSRVVLTNMIARRTVPTILIGRAPTLRKSAPPHSGNVALPTLYSVSKVI